MLENKSVLIENLISEEAKRHGLKAIRKRKIDKPLSLPKGLSQVKRNLVIDYGGEYGFHLPDIDMVIYNPESHDVIAVFSIIGKSRKKLEQAKFWKNKLLQDEVTKHIKFYSISFDYKEIL